MRIAVAATPHVAIPTLEAILNSEHQLISVITQPDRMAGRGQEMKATPVAEWAASKNIPLLKPLDSSELREVSASVDCVVTVGYGVLLPEAIINIPLHGFLNLHFSLLPRWRGAAPVQRSIQAGDQETGVTVFKLDRGMDTGPIYVQKNFHIPQDFRSAELFQSLSVLGAQAVLETLNEIRDGVSPREQNDLDASVAPKISKADALISWAKSGDEILRNLKAFYPSPVAWTQFRGEVLRIESARNSTIEGLKPGQLHISDGGLHIGTGTTALQLLQVVPAGKKSTDVKAWLNGARIQAGEYFE